MPLPRHSPLTDAERFPLLTETGRARLQYLREHPSAPRYNHPCGEQLTSEGLQNVKDFAARLETAPRGWQHGEIPAWLHAFTEKCLTEVPFYRQRGGAADNFFTLPACTRDDLARTPWAFVPDSQSIDELVVYDTSGTTGPPLLILSHPATSASYLPALQWALARRGVTLAGGDGVALASVAKHRQTLTYPAVSSYLGQAGFVKISLHPDNWRTPEDCVKFLNDCAPEVYTGDPLALLALSELPLTHRPKALVSSATTLLPGFRETLETHFGCPVLNVYSMNETRFIAVAEADHWTLVPHDLYVEILDPQGHACAPGVRGEITVSGGRNPFLPLLRYRTGDYAALDFTGDVPVLVDFTGRPPVIFRALGGDFVHSLDISHVLRQFPLAQFALHQAADGSLCLRVRGPGLSYPSLANALHQLFGDAQVLTIEELPETESGRKALPFSSDL